MINQQLLDYVRQQLSMGVSKDDIKKALATKGWNQQDIEETFSVTDTTNTPKPPSTSLPTEEVHPTLVIQSSKKKKSLIIMCIMGTLFLFGAVVGYIYVLPIIQKGDLFSFFQSKNTPSVACSPGETNTNKAEVKQLTDLEDQIRIISTTIESSTESSVSENDFFTTSQMYLQLDELGKKYNELSADITKRQVSVTPVELITSVYTQYCSPQIAVSAVEQSPSTSESLSEQLSQSSFGNLTCNLENKTYTDSQLPTALYHMGFKLNQAGQFDDSVNFYKCAAEKYYDLTSMYRVAQVYEYGSAEYQKLIPDTLVKTEIKPDPKEAYYWISALIYTESAQKTGILDAMTQTGWNIIAMLDSLQRSQSLTDSDLRIEEEKAVSFVSKRYPEIGRSGYKSGYENETHSMGSMIDALEEEISTEGFLEEVVKEVKTEMSLPDQINEFTTLVDITAEPTALRYHFIFSGIDTSLFSNSYLKNLMRDGVCETAGMKDILKEGIDIELSYVVESSAQKYFISFTESDCLQ